MTTPLRQVPNRPYEAQAGDVRRLDAAVRSQTREMQAGAPAVLIRCDAIQPGGYWACPQSYFDVHGIDFGQYRSDKADKYRSDWKTTRPMAIAASEALLLTGDLGQRVRTVFLPRPRPNGGEIAAPAEVARELDELAGGRPAAKGPDELLTLEDAVTAPFGLA
jgi:hypothetical protein